MTAGLLGHRDATPLAHGKDAQIDALLNGAILR
jgi:hypothetical protein